MKQASCWRGVPPFRCRHERPAVGLMTGNLELRLRLFFASRNYPIRTGGLEEKDNFDARASSEKEKNPNRAGWSFRLGEEYAVHCIICN